VEPVERSVDVFAHLLADLGVLNGGQDSGNCKRWRQDGRWTSVNQLDRVSDERVESGFANVAGCNVRISSDFVFPAGDGPAPTKR
jgi:hypothetical protein